MPLHVQGLYILIKIFMHLPMLPKIFLGLLKLIWVFRGLPKGFFFRVFKVSKVFRGVLRDYLNYLDYLMNV